jgi:glycosyltransferase involved in cell wall biosynthesis
MKILYTVSTFPPIEGKGGAPVSAGNLCQRLSDRGHDVTVFTTDMYKKDQRMSVQDQPIYRDGVEVYYFRNLSYRLAWDYGIPLPIGEVRQLRKNLSEFDIAHVDLLRGFEAASVHHYLTKSDIPYVLQPRGAVPRLSKSRMKKVFDVCFGNRIVSDADRIIASSDIEAGHYPNVYPHTDLGKIVRIPNGIKEEQYRDLPSRGQFRSYHDIGSDENVILYLSRIHERKGGDLLVEAFASLQNEFPKTTLVFVGPDDGYLSQLREKVSKLGLSQEVVFAGPLYSDEKLQAYVDADVFVLPSKNTYESFGNVVVEALSCETPVVVTQYCGVTDWLNGEVSRIVPATDSAIQNALIELLSDPSLRKSMGKNGRSLVFNQFTWEQVATKTEQIYQNILRS